MFLAIFDLYVGVGNDAVNFLNSAIGCKAAKLKTLIFLSGIGVFAGASLSNGMMDIARHGIYQPQYFYFSEVMCILMAVMLTDIILLDLFNSLGLPTSTTVSMVFELLGGTVAISLIKVHQNSSFMMSNLLNTDKAFSVITGIFLSVPIAFIFGSVVQYLARLMFSFDFKKKLKYFIGIYGGIAITAIIYFMLIKGLKSATFMKPEYLAYIHENTLKILLMSFVFFSVISQILYLLKLNVLRLIVLLGTFSLAMAFAGNDLVNFIGVPLAGYSSFVDFMANGHGNYDSFLMTSLNGSAKTPVYFLLIAGIIMIVSLATSKKAHNVVKTSVNLARQDEGDESFGSTQVARSLVRSASGVAKGINYILPIGLKRWIDSRFSMSNVKLENEAAFDLVRASVNLVIAAILISFGTSMKLPLSTTYVTFMVAMGTSLSDRAWGRESAVYRITGVLSVIGGWFITAGVAFVLSMIAAWVIYYGEILGTVALVILDVFLIVKSHFSYKNKQEKKKTDPLVVRLVNEENPEEALNLYREYSFSEIEKFLGFTQNVLTLVLDGFVSEKLRKLRKSSELLADERTVLKKQRRIGTIGMRNLDASTAIEKGGYYFQNNDYMFEILNSLKTISSAAKEHVDNNFIPLEEFQKEEIMKIKGELNDFLNKVREMFKDRDLASSYFEINVANNVVNNIMKVRKDNMNNIKDNVIGIRTGLVYMTMIQELQNMAAYTINLIKVNQRFTNE